MDTSKVMVLGGYGTAGTAICELLLGTTLDRVRVCIAGRRLDRCQELANRLASRFGDHRVEASRADAADQESLSVAFNGVNMVIVASSTARYTREVVEAAISRRVDYFDILLSSSKLAELSSMREAIERSGLCFITDGGFHPGLPAALVRHVAPRFDALQSARVGSVIRVNWASLNLAPSTLDDFVTEFADLQSMTYVDRRWTKVGANAFFRPARMDFGTGLGKQPCYPMHLEEMQPLPDLYPDLQETGFFVGGLGWFVDAIVTPLAIASLKVAPTKGVKPMGRLMGWSLRTFSKPPYCTALKVEAHGLRAGRPHREEITVIADDAYFLTAAPVVACVLQYLDGGLRRSGLQLQAHAVDPDRLMDDMERMGVEVVDSARTGERSCSA